MRLVRWIARWRESKDPHVGLDSLLMSARTDAAPQERLAWLHDLGAWLFAGLGESDEARASSPQSVRLKHLLAVLERAPDRKHAFAAALRGALGDRDAFDLLTETGLPRETGFAGEFIDRVLSKMLPEPPPADLASLFVLVFSDREQAEMVERIDEDIWRQLLALIDFGADAGAHGYRERLVRSAENALVSLAIQVCATTLHPALRRRMESSEGTVIPTFGLPEAARAFVANRSLARGGDLVRGAQAFREAFGVALVAVENVYAHLDRQGVSIGIVYQLERVRAQVQRIGELTDLLSLPDKSPGQLRYFLANLVRDVHDRRSVRVLLAQNFSLAARKVVERSAQAGEHYITRTREEYVAMVKSAAGGGAMTALTVHAKFALSSLHLAPFYDGLAASFNYSTSFVAMQLCGFTLATKQPAMTGPALAARMHGLQEPAKMSALVDEVANLMRSQSAAIIGNVFVVAPVAYALAVALIAAFGHLPLDAEKAKHTIDSLSIASWVPLYAAFTGVLLWISSLVAGWADNWFAYRRLGPAIANHRRLTYVFGPTGAKRIADFLEHQIAGLAGNVSLGFLLGSLPVFFAFYGLPIEVRHVTLSTGQLAVAVSVLGWGVVGSAAFGLAVAGIALIGVLNLGVSFVLALNIAIRARGIRGADRFAIYRAILHRLRVAPASFLLPARAG
jgi:site-specific recombinase